MRDDVNDDEWPARLVTVGQFRVSLVTRSDFAAFVEATGYETNAEKVGTGFLSRDTQTPVHGLSWRSSSSATTNVGDEPVSQVSWFDARAMCHWSGHRLPTEAEWEIAARQGAIDTSRQVWCEDWYSPDFHRSEQRVNPLGPKSGTQRVARGGGTRLTERFHWLPDYSSDALGIALVHGRLVV